MRSRAEKSTASRIGVGCHSYMPWRSGSPTTSALGGVPFGSGCRRRPTFRESDSSTDLTFVLVYLRKTVRIETMWHSYTGECVLRRARPL